MFSWSRKSNSLPSSVNGQIFLDSTIFHWEELKNILKDEWNIDIVEKPEGNTLIFSAENMLAACTFFPHTADIPKLDEYCKNSRLWGGSINSAKSHKGFISLTVTNGKSSTARYKLFTKIAGSICAMNSALAVCLPPLVISSRDYKCLALDMKYDELPVFLWVNFEFKMEKRGISAYTTGLSNFNKNEVEIIYSKKSFEKIFDFLSSFTKDMLRCECDMKTFLSCEKLKKRFSFKFSSGFYIKGKTLKIDY